MVSPIWAILALAPIWNIVCVCDATARLSHRDPNRTTILGGGNDKLYANFPLVDLAKTPRQEVIKLKDHSNGQAKWIIENVYRQLSKDFSGMERTFVEFGARDGVYESNTLFLEQYFKWGGILVEGNLETIDGLRDQRRCLVGNMKGSCVWAALHHTSNMTMHSSPGDKFKSFDQLSPKDKIHHANSRVITTTLGDIFKKLGVRKIDYLSADCEGCETDALMGFDWDKHPVGIVSLELPEHHCKLVENFVRRNYTIVPMVRTKDTMFLSPETAGKMAMAPNLEDICNANCVKFYSANEKKNEVLRRCGNNKIEGAKFWISNDAWPVL